MTESGKVLRLGGRELRCVDKIPIGLLFDLAEAMESKSEMKAVAAMSTFLRTIVVKEEREALSEALHDVDHPVGFEDLNHAVGDLMVAYSGRPFVRPSPSRPGPAATGGSSRVVSLWRGTDREDDQSSKDGRRAAS